MMALTDSPIARSVQAMLPMILSQIFILWLVVSRQASYVQAMLMPAMEMWLIMLTAALFFSPNLRVAGERLSSLILTTGVLVLVFVFFLLVSAIPESGNNAVTDPTVFRAFALAEKTFSMSTLKNGLIYVTVAYAMSATAAVASRNFGRWWYANMVAPAAMILVALLASVFFSFLVIQSFAGSKVPDLVPSTILTTFFLLTRLLLVYFYQSRMTPEKFEDLYAKFRAGREWRLKVMTRADMERS